MVVVRVSADKYVVREQQGHDIYFKFTEKIQNLSPGFPEILIVDFRKDVDSVTVLFYGQNGYYLAKAVNKPLPVRPPEHWLPIRDLDNEKWHLADTMLISDPYPDSIGAEAGIVEARLNHKGNVEFQLSEDNATSLIVDEFSISNERAKDDQDHWSLLLKNGKKWTDSSVWNRRYRPFVIIEAEEVEILQRSSPNVIRILCERRFAGNNEAIQWYRTNFKDKNAAEEIIRIIEKAYAVEDRK